MGFAAQRVTAEDPYQALVAVKIPGSLLNGLEARGLMIQGPAFKTSQELEEQWWSEALPELSQYGWTLITTNDDALRQECGG